MIEEKRGDFTDVVLANTAVLMSLVRFLITAGVIDATKTMDFLEMDASKRATAVPHVKEQIDVILLAIRNSITKTADGQH